MGDSRLCTDDWKDFNEMVGTELLNQPVKILFALNKSTVMTQFDKTLSKTVNLLHATNRLFDIRIN